MVARPARDEVLAYRAHVEAALLDALPGLPPAVRDLVALGCQHEEQHQDLLLTDILHLLSCNPIEPPLWPAPRPAPLTMPVGLRRELATAPVRASGWMSVSISVGAVDFNKKTTLRGIVCDCLTTTN